MTIEKMNQNKDEMQRRPEAMVADFPPRFRSKNLEQAFRQGNLDEDKKKNARIVLICLLISSIFIYLDWRVLPSVSFHKLLSVRIAFALAGAICLVVSSKIRNEKAFEDVVFSFALAICGLQWAVHQFSPEGYAVSVAFNMLIIMGFYLILPAGVVYQAIPAILLSVDSVFVLPRKSVEETTAIMSALFFSNLIGLLFSCQYQKSSRIQFKTWMDDQENRNTLDTILSASPIGICLVQNRVLQWANNAFVGIFGFDSEEDLKGKSTELFYAEEEYRRVGEILYVGLASGAPVETDAVLKRKDGARFPAHIKMSAYDPDNPIDKAIIAVSDISWRKQAESDRIKKENLKVVLETAGAVCHEMNQPLQALSAFTEVLMSKPEIDLSIYRKLAKIRVQVERIAGVTNKLKKITSYETMDYLSSKILDIDKASGEGKKEDDPEG